MENLLLWIARTSEVEETICQPELILAWFEEESWLIDRIA